MKNEPKALTPKLRFPEFKGGPGWDTVNGNKLFNLIDRRPAPPGLPVLAITQDHGPVPRDHIDYHVSVSEASIASYKEVRPADFIISLRSFQGGIEYSRFHGICSPAYLILKRNGDGEDHFFRHMFKSDRFIRQLTRNIEGLRDGKMISYRQFSEQLLPTPSAAEQRKIATCLTSLDEFLAAEERKLRALRAHKNGLMQNLFPREGESRPRLRFPEFRDLDEWEETPLDQVIEIASGQVDPTEPPYCDLPHVGGENIDAETGGLQGLRSAREDAVISGKYPFDERDILYSKIRPALNKVASPEFRGICSADIYPIRPSSEELLRDYLIYLLRSRSFVNYATKHSTRGKIPKINREVLLAYGALMPPPAEQQRIAACLLSLDTLIAAESRKLYGLRAYKKGLMQGLFPTSEGM